MKGIEAPDKHPTYPNSTITEVVCDFHFKQPDGVGWQQSLFGEFFKVIQDQYPTMEPGVNMGLRINVGPQGIGPQYLEKESRIRFSRPDNEYIVQLAPLNLVLNVLPPYPSWSKVMEEIENVWSKALGSVPVESITRIGLRYINRFPKDEKDFSLVGWIQSGDFVPRGILESKSNFLSRVQNQIDDNNRLVVTVTDVEPDEDNKLGSVILDIDRIVEDELESSTEMLLKAIDKLHSDVWDVFSSSKDEKLDSYLNRME